MRSGAQRQEIGAVDVEVVSSIAGLEALRPEWIQLWSHCRDATPFQSPAWLIPWWRHLGDGELWMIEVRRDARLIGLVPLYLHERAGGRRDLLLVGCGTSDYLDVLCEEGAEGEVLEHVFAFLERERRRWNACEFSQLTRTSALLRTRAPRGWSDEQGYAERCLILTLPACVDSIDAAIPKRMSQNVGYYRRRAGQRGPLRIERVSADDLDRSFSELARLHATRWAERGEAGVLADARVRATHSEALPALLQCGLLRFYVLHIGERVVACLYGLSDARGGGRFYYYLGAFDPDFRDVSPGTLLVAHAIGDAIREGAGAFDFLRGAESYKYLWGARDSPTYRRLLRHG